MLTQRFYNILYYHTNSDNILLRHYSVFKIIKSKLVIFRKIKDFEKIHLVIYFQNLPVSNFAKSKLDITSKELEEERAEANNVLKK